MTKAFVDAPAAAAALPFRLKSASLLNWTRPLATVFDALHESRRRQAARHIARYQFLIDRYAPPARDQAMGQADA
jgi:hypothetical protein